MKEKAGRRIGGSIAGLALALGLSIAVVPETGQAGPTLWSSGDIIVADSSADQIQAVDPASGAATPISSGFAFRFPADVTFDKNGDILVVDRDAYVGPGAIIRVDASGAQTFVSSNEISAEAGGKQLFKDPISLDRKGGSLYVGDFGGQPKRIIKVDIATGKQSLVTKGDKLGSPFGVRVDGDKLLVADAGRPDTALGRQGGLVQVDPRSGKQKAISSHGDFKGPTSVVAEDNKSALLIDPEAFDFKGALFRVNRKTGAQKTILKNSDIANPNGIALAGGNKAYVTGALKPGVTNGQLFGVNLNSGKETLINGTSFNNPLGITVAP